MQSIIKEIIQNPKNKIKVRNYFDSHFIIEFLIEQYSDEYFKFISKSVNPTSAKIANFIHGLISLEIKKLTQGEEPILKKCEGESISFNIHNIISECALWERIR